MGVMRTEPQPSDREVLAGLVERVTYQNAENGFRVIRVKARGHRDLVTVVGHAAVIFAPSPDVSHYCCMIERI
jgi:exodeoxyribonuclease V alpha subunit